MGKNLKLLDKCGPVPSAKRKENRIPEKRKRIILEFLEKTKKCVDFWVCRCHLNYVCAICGPHLTVYETFLRNPEVGEVSLQDVVKYFNFPSIRNEINEIKANLDDKDSGWCEANVVAHLTAKTGPESPIPPCDAAMHSSRIAVTTRFNALPFDSDMTTNSIVQIKKERGEPINEETMDLDDLGESEPYNERSDAANGGLLETVKVDHHTHEDPGPSEECFSLSKVKTEQLEDGFENSYNIISLRRPQWSTITRRPYRLTQPRKKVMMEFFGETRQSLKNWRCACWSGEACPVCKPLPMLVEKMSLLDGNFKPSPTDVQSWLQDPCFKKELKSLEEEILTRGNAWPINNYNYTWTTETKSDLERGDEMNEVQPKKKKPRLERKTTLISIKEEAIEESPDMQNEQDGFALSDDEGPGVLLQIKEEVRDEGNSVIDADPPGILIDVKEEVIDEGRHAHKSSQVGGHEHKMEWSTSKDDKPTSHASINIKEEKGDGMEKKAFVLHPGNCSAAEVLDFVEGFVGERLQVNQVDVWKWELILQHVSTMKNEMKERDERGEE